MVLSSWQRSCQSHCESSLGSRDECRTAPGGCRPLDQANRLEPQARLDLCRLGSYSKPYIHHRHLLSLLEPES